LTHPNHPGRRARTVALRDGGFATSNARGGVAGRRRAQIGTCLVLREDPYLAEDISPRRRKDAEEMCTAGTLKIKRGRWSGWPRDDDRFGLLVLEGLLLRRVDVGGRHAVELLGAGDVIRPYEIDEHEHTLERTTAWRALQATRLAVLDEGVLNRMASYPRVIGRLLDRSVDRSRRLTVNLAIMHHRRVDVRLLMLFWHLADRWGRPSDRRVLVPFRLSHAVLADLVAAQRPTITTALSDLERRQLLRPMSEGWLLLGGPPRSARLSASSAAKTRG
jgi:CRP/FNR family transcriptional regulator, cyclic AMP receptor protein